MDPPRLVRSTGSIPSKTMAPPARASYYQFCAMRGAYHAKRILNIHTNDSVCVRESTRQTPQEWSPSCTLAPGVVQVAVGPANHHVHQYFQPPSGVT